MSQTGSAGQGSPLPDPSAAPRLSSEAEELLAYRVVKRSIGYLLGVIGVVGTVLGFFGYNAVRDLNSAKDELITSKAELEAEVRRTRELNESLQRQLVQEQSRLQGEVEQMRSTADAYQRIFFDQMVQTVNRVADVAARANQTTQESDLSLVRVDSAVAALYALSGQLEVELGDAERKREEFDSVVALYGTVIDTIRQKVFGSWTVVAREKSQTLLPGTGLMVRMGTIRKNLLRDFEVADSATGERLVRPQHVPTGQPIDLEFNGFSYRLIPRYTIEHWPGKDVAGIQVDQLRVRERT